MTRQILGFLLLLPFRLIAFLLGLWCFGALWYCAGERLETRVGWALIFTGGYLAVWWFVRFRYRAWGYFLMALPVMVFFASIRPDPATVYRTPWARQAEFVFDGRFVTIRNLRDFRYRTPEDYEVRYREETFDLDKASKLYLAVSHWDGLENIAHTLLSFEFSDGKYVALSVETRVPVDREQGSLPGLFKQFGLGMIFGTESDLLKLRATYRGETIYLYPTTATPEAVRTAFLNLARRADRLSRQPEFYNTLTGNCTTVLIPPLRPILLDWQVDLRAIFNGLIDHLAFEKGYLDFGGSRDFFAAKKQYLISADHPESGDAYSRAIRH